MLLRASLIISSFSLTACAGMNARLPDIALASVKAEQETQMQISLTRYEQVNDRLQGIGRKVLAANAELCEKTRADIGVQTARLKDMPKALRARAKLAWGLDDKPRIIYVSGAQKDLRGEYFVHKGEAVNPLKADFNPAQVKVTSGGNAVKFEAEQVCHYPIRLRYSPAINAYADGRHIIVTTGMMDFASDNELALIIGHELAHNTQSHIRKIVQNRILSFGRPNFTRQFESEADYVGLYYMARAGYDVSMAPEFWRKLAKVSIKSLDKPSSHPITPERFVRLNAAVQEIKDKQARGEPLLPNMRGGS